MTRLFTADEITKGLRGWIADQSSWAGYLITCDWCLSIWIAPLPAVALLRWSDRLPVQIALLALALSAITGLLATIERRLDP
jgi:hypothetical protein